MTNHLNAIGEKQNDLVFNPGSERNLISICLKDNDKLIELDELGLYPEHLSVPGHQKIIMAMNYLQSKEIKAEPMAIMEVLQGRTKAEVEELGGMDYLIRSEEHTSELQSRPHLVEK